MTWLLDTNVLIDAARGWPAPVRRRLSTVSPDDVAISAVSAAELWYGALKAQDPKEKRALWTRVLEPYTVLPFDRAAAERHAELRHGLKQRPIGERDLFIAAIAAANDLTLVTRNTAEFSRVPGLAVEDWSV
ncbi:MAG: type II toxin-antitoxin system VapC family toxin [Gemmatimonadetes bacterium]|nr:type II toxin-antitoxin system VapC family toxin [Gemmatimonadota bacterium]